MQFDFDIPTACGVQADDEAPTVIRIQEAALYNQRTGPLLRSLLDAIGERSRKAQGLGKAVTAGSSATVSSNNVYLLAEGRLLLGLLKTGPKHLFVSRGPTDGLVEINAQCVLDFYIVEGKQRGGLGRLLFTTMLEVEGLHAEKLAYDRPSPKCLAFLRKHFGLSRYTPQNNNFVVFDSYFSTRNRRSSRCEPQAECLKERAQLADEDLGHSYTSRNTREEVIAAGLPSGGRRPIAQREREAAQVLAGRRQNGCNHSANNSSHEGKQFFDQVGRSLHHHGLREGGVPIGARA
jgi:alpha-tubulin N-acetyltransferase 1